MLKLHLNQTGDTIVEVLISLGVVSVVLVTAFGITNRSRSLIQAAQESDQATKLAQSQIEFLRAAKFTPGTDLCFKANGQPTATNTDCVVDSAGNPTTQTPSYKLSITMSGASQYAVQAAWDSAAGTGTSNVTLYYRQ